MMPLSLEEIVSRAFLRITNETVQAPRLITRSEIANCDGSDTESVVTPPKNSVAKRAARALRTRINRFKHSSLRQGKLKEVTDAELLRDARTLALESLSHLVAYLGNAKVVVVAPKVNKSTADSIPLLAITALQQIMSDHGDLALLTTWPREEANSFLLPPTVIHAVLPEGWDQLDPSLQDWVLVQALEVASPKSVIVINDKTAIKSFARFDSSAQYPNLRAIFISHAFQYELPEVLCQFINTIVFTDMTVSAERLCSEAKAITDVRVISPFPTPDSATVVKYMPAYRKRYFGDEDPFRILAFTELGKTKDRITSVEVELGSGSTPAEICYLPAIPDFLSDEPVEDYHAILISGSDLHADSLALQAALLGLPLLIESSELAERFPESLFVGVPGSAGIRESIEFLSRNISDRQDLINRAHIRAHYSINGLSFEDQFRALLGTD